MHLLGALASFAFGVAAALASELTADEVIDVIVHDEFEIKSDFGKSLLDAIKEEDVEQSVEEHFKALGGASGQARVLRLVAALRPLFTSLPKDGDGRLAYQTARYAIHRFMMKAHAWFMRGLEPSSQEKAHASSVAAVAEWVPPYLHGQISKRSGMLGASLEDLAVMAAALEDLVAGEVRRQMVAMYEYLGISTAEPTERGLAVCAIDCFVLYHFTWTLMETTKDSDPFDLDSSVTTQGRREALCNGGVLGKYFPWSQDVFQWRNAALAAVADSAHDLMSFQQVVGIAYRVAGETDQVNDEECTGLRHRLFALESNPGSGRVTLESYHGAKGYRQFPFSESRDMLRNASVLDESTEPPTIVVANYVSARINCVMPSSIYALCCKLPCDDILMQLEQKLASPFGTAREIASGIGVDLSPEQFKRLDQIVRINGGRAPIHSEAFAIWLHHVYPRDCPLVKPNSASSFPMTAGEWLHDGDKSWAEENEEWLASARQGLGSMWSFFFSAFAGIVWFLSGNHADVGTRARFRLPGGRRAVVVRSLIGCLAIALGMVALMDALHFGTSLLMLICFSFSRGILQIVHKARTSASSSDWCNEVYKQI